MADLPKITRRTKICFTILLWIAERLWDGTYEHQIKALVTEIKTLMNQE